mmetsp:Transcript_17699/g.52642  ORF Transcript_17699/g.52642 Transcript_17699/m.52642 type:complete len:211 (-) Transcript_17699:135-767(-)
MFVTRTLGSPRQRTWAQAWEALRGAGSRHCARSGASRRRTMVPEYHSKSSVATFWKSLRMSRPTSVERLEGRRVVLPAATSWPVLASSRRPAPPARGFMAARGLPGTASGTQTPRSASHAQPRGARPLGRLTLPTLPRELAGDGGGGGAWRGSKAPAPKPELASAGGVTIAAIGASAGRSSKTRGPTPVAGDDSSMAMASPSSAGRAIIG